MLELKPKTGRQSDKIKKSVVYKPPLVTTIYVPKANPGEYGYR